MRFYQLGTTTLERALPRLLDKILARGERAVVMAGSPERVEALNAALWTFEDRSFLPHGSARDGFAEDQPVWLTPVEENPNGATVLILTDGATAAGLERWGMVLEIFDGHQDDAVKAAEAHRQAYKEAGHALAFWRQSDRGAWEKAPG
ncbi:MAG: DNA polymerase III subunit chi [Pseudomonadota bacterium]